jgi:hypothetical protein
MAAWDASCCGCSERDARIADLERRLAELEARLKTNASNSSTPPSANPLGADKPVVKKKSKRKRGGQPDHPPHLKQLLSGVAGSNPVAPTHQKASGTTSSGWPFFSSRGPFRVKGGFAGGVLNFAAASDILPRHLDSGVLLSSAVQPSRLSLLWQGRHETTVARRRTTMPVTIISRLVAMAIK